MGIIPDDDGPRSLAHLFDPAFRAATIAKAMQPEPRKLTPAEEEDIRRDYCFSLSLLRMCVPDDEADAAKGGI